MSPSPPRLLPPAAAPPSAPARSRRTSRLLATVAALIVLVAALTGCWSAAQREVSHHVNATRNAHGLPSLRGDVNAFNRAQEWSNHMASTGRLAHRGTWSGLGRWCAAAENVGYGPSVASVHNAFMRSASHRANILGRFDRVGTGIARRGNTVWITQIFLRSC